MQELVWGTCEDFDSEQVLGLAGQSGAMETLSCYICRIPQSLLWGGKLITVRVPSLLGNAAWQDYRAKDWRSILW
jgi:hypothetical protein